MAPFSTSILEKICGNLENVLVRLFFGRRRRRARNSGRIGRLGWFI